MGKSVKCEDAENPYIKKIEDLEKNINEIEDIGKNLKRLNEELWMGYGGDTIDAIQYNIYKLEKTLKIINEELGILENKDIMPAVAEDPYIKEKGGLGNIVSKAKEKMADVKNVTRKLSDDLSDPHKLELIRKNRRY